jgi:uncharacterized protein (DUF1800 family)
VEIPLEDREIAGAQDEQPEHDAPRSRRKFIFLGALAGASLIAPRANAQGVGRPTRINPRRLQRPQFETGVVNESVAALPDWTDSRVRLVRRITMGVTAADLSEVRRLGYQDYLNRQLNYAEIDDSLVETAVLTRWPNLALPSSALTAVPQGTLQQNLQEATIFRAAFSQRQLYERMVEFWSDHFNIQMAKVGYLKIADDRDVIRKHALGKFRDLLMASAKSAAMMAYLDQQQSRRGAPNENYARELMELHTVGVDNGYTQTDVAELARVLTGWTIQGQGSFQFNPTLHDYGAKTVMGQSFPAMPTSVGAAAISEGEQFVDFLASHPNTATYVSTKMLRWLLQAEPTANQINVASRAWRATRGDIRLVVRAILNEGWLALAPAKFKRPFHLLVSALRATGAEVVSAAALPGRVNTLGQPLFQFETPDGYPDKVEYWSGNILPRWAFATFISTQNSGTSLRVSTAPFLTGTPDAAIDKINTDFFGGEMSLPLRVALLNYIKGAAFTDGRVRETIALALSASEFQWY